VVQENSYYAFGMQMAGGLTPTDANKKYITRAVNGRMI